ncbi:MAG TPA: glycosyltransferase family 87 protein [Terriglobales bacterium]|nr:glycosyltransferase family 87 protein [Terriglobales bacterium]
MATAIETLRGKHWRLAEIAAVGLVALTLSAAMVRLLTPTQDAPTDFFQDYSSARNLLLGKPVYVTMQQARYDYLGQRTSQRTPNNGHPPASVLLVIPFAWTDYARAGILWNWATLVALAASITILRSKLKQDPSIWQWMLLLVAFTVWPPLWFHVTQEQFGLVFLLLITIAWSAGREGQDGRAGCLIGVAGAIKFFPVVLLVYFAFRRRWRAVILGLSSFVLVNLVALLVLGVGTYKDYLALAPYLSIFSTLPQNVSLTGFFSRLFSPSLSWLLILIGSTAILLTIWRQASRKPADFDSEFALTLTGALLLFPLTWQHSFVMLLLPLAICVTRFADARANSRYLLLASWLLMAVPEPLLPGFSGHALPSTARSLGVLSVNFYGLLACFIAQTQFSAAPRTKVAESVW